MKKLTIQELEANSSQSIYVLSNLYNTGDVNILINKDGTKNHCVIPSTKVQIPYNLTNFYPKADILNSPDFRTLVQKSVLTIIDDEYAEELMKDPKVISEMECLNQINQNMINNHTTKNDNVDYSVDYSDDDNFLIHLDRDDINYKTKAEIFNKNKDKLNLKQLKTLKTKHNEKINGKINLLYKAIKDAIKERE